MDRATVTDLHRRLLHNMLHKTTDLAPGESSVPAQSFICPQQLAREKEILFRKTPQPVAFSAELPQPETFLALDVLDVPVLLTRDDKGQLRAFINACTHRGARVANGEGQARTLLCQFHGWAYKLDGSLRGRPENDCFDTDAKQCGLQALPVSERCGIVVLGMESTIPQERVDSAIAEIEVQLKAFNLNNYRPLERRQFEVAANWKLVNDLSLESYHFNVLHRNSVAQVLAPNAVVDTYEKHSRWAFPLQSIDKLRDINEEDWPDSLQGSCTYTLYPGVMFIFNALGAQMIRAEPGGSPGESRVVYAGVAAEGCDEAQAREAYNFGGSVFADEDLPIAEQCQAGLAAGKRNLLLGKNEPLLQFWHAVWQRASG